MPILGGKCYLHEHCTVNNSICIDQTCQCGPKYNYLTDKMCMITSLGTVCKVASDCDDDYRFECSKDNICVCKENFEILNNSTCLPKLGKACWNNEKCFTENALCVDSKCQCKLGYKAALNGTCIDSMLGKSCEIDMDCDDLNHLRCSDHKVCICQIYHVTQISSCFSLLYRFCDNDIRCKVNNSICIDNLCQCRNGYVADSPSICLPSPLGRNCTSDFDCEKELYAECSNAGICVCNENHVMKNESRCEPFLGGRCYDNESCKIDNSACIENKCQCNLGFMNTDKYRCLPSSLGKFCQDSFDCDNIWHMKCSSNICICKDNHSIVNFASCMPLLGAICMFQDSCASNNSICVDHECQCLPTFERVSKDHCVPSKCNQNIYL
ncbi:prion-like-(Q/N-rich) domain-bearing protein 25 [Cotesia glomerata]|uniref:prion-like-(Q/N-rich) domain-bearing protein 25 n=1 Tax=Cotesia glomerata TaxID=32391 RepID=UPI001D0127EE|nr:prion-like-(Q/N-rich) domain-bearing protein 25 [Cotesia glomerata]